MSLIWLDRKLGPMRIRAWGLMVNFAFNAMALVGLAYTLRSGSGVTTLLVVGAVGTVSTIALLAVPDREDSLRSTPEEASALAELGHAR